MPITPTGQERTVSCVLAHSRLIFFPVPAQFSVAFRAHVPAGMEIVQFFSHLSIAACTSQFDTWICVSGRGPEIPVSEAVATAGFIFTTQTKNQTRNDLKITTNRPCCMTPPP